MGLNRFDYSKSVTEKRLKNFELYFSSISIAVMNPKYLFIKTPHNFTKKKNTNTCSNALLQRIETNLLLTTIQGGITMDIREGLIPTALGTAVTAAGYALKQTRGTNKMIANTVFGFGLAHVVLGVIDLVEHRR